MNKCIIFSFTVLLLVPVMATDAFALIVFSENFDGTVTGWSPRSGNSHDELSGNPAYLCPDDSGGTGLITILPTGNSPTPNEPAPSPLNWGFVGINFGTPDFIDVLLACEKEFNVPATGDYLVSVNLGTMDCTGGGNCLVTSTLLIDGVPVVSAQGEDPPGPVTNVHPPGPTTPTTPVSGEFTVPLTTSGNPHTVEIELTVVDSVGAPFYVSVGETKAHFDDILIQTDFPVGSVSIPIDSTSLFVASEPSMPLWLAPLALSAAVAGMGLVLVRKN